MGVQVTYRSQKGAPLTIAEQDANLSALARAVDVLAQTAGGVYAIGFAQDPVTKALTIRYSDGTMIGPVVLPVKPLRFRGAWAAGAAYDVGDVVRIDGSAYGVAIAHAATDTPSDIAAGRLVLAAQRGDVGEAPDDGKTYARKAKAWTDVGTELAAATTAIAELRTALETAQTTIADLVARVEALEAK